jgi:hypothetical protein
MGTGGIIPPSFKSIFSFNNLFDVKDFLKFYEFDTFTYLIF